MIAIVVMVDPFTTSIHPFDGPLRKTVAAKELKSSALGSQETWCTMAALEKQQPTLNSRGWMISFRNQDSLLVGSSCYFAGMLGSR